MTENKNVNGRMTDWLEWIRWMDMWRKREDCRSREILLRNDVVLREMMTVGFPA